MEEKATNTICRVLLEPKKSLDEFGENAIFQPWEFMDVPADELQENDVIAFLCDGDMGSLIVVTNKARIYKFNWGAWDYERVRAFCGSRALGTPLISPDKKIIHEKNWESEYMGFGSFLFMKMNGTVSSRHLRKRLTAQNSCLHCGPIYFYTCLPIKVHNV